MTKQTPLTPRRQPLNPRTLQAQRQGRGQVATQPAKPTATRTPTGRQQQIPITHPQRLLPPGKPTASQQLAMLNGRFRAQALWGTLLLSTLALIIVAGIMWLKGDPRLPQPIAEAAAPIMQPVKNAFAPKPCGNEAPLLKVVYSDGQEGQALLEYPSRQSISYDSFIELDHPQEVLEWARGDPLRVELIATHLASLMLPVQGFDFVTEFRLSVQEAIESGSPCIYVPDVAKWANDSVFSALGLMLTPTPEAVALANYPTPAIRQKPDDVKLAFDLPGAPQPTPVPTSKPAAKKTAPPAHVEIGTSFKDAFTRGLETIALKCAQTYQDPVKSGACYSVLVSRYVKELPAMANKTLREKETAALETQNTLASQASGLGNICATNLGTLPWAEATSKKSVLWKHTDTYYAIGSPGQLYLVDSQAQVCALIVDSAGRYGNVKWQTYPVDPFFPEYGGSHDGRGTLSLNPPDNGLYVQVGKVYLGPIQSP